MNHRQTDPPRQDGHDPQPPDDTAAFDAQPKEDKSWAIRSMPADVIDIAVAAAKRQRLTVGEWLAVAIRDRVARERHSGTAPLWPDAALTTPLEGQVLVPAMLSPIDVPGALNWRRFSIEEWTAYLEVVRLSGTLRPDGNPAPGLLKAVERRLRDILIF